MGCSGIYNPFLILRMAFVLSLLFGFSVVSAQEVLPETNTVTIAPVVDKLLEAGRQALRGGDLEASARAYREVLRLRPESPEALYQLAIYNFRKQDYVRGFELIKKAVKVSPGNPYPRLALAKAQGEVGEYEAAIEQYQKIIRLGEAGSRPVQTAELEMNLMKFRLAARNRDREQLLKVGSILTSRYSANLSILKNVASVYVRAGFFDQAQEIYLSLLKSSPKDPRIDLSLGEMYERMRQPEKTLAHYDAAVNKAGGGPLEKVAQIKSGVLKALLLMQAGNKEQAYEQFLEVIKLDANNVVANMNIAAYLYGKHDLEGAKNAYLRVIEKQPRNLDAQFRLGIVYLDMGDLVDGVRQLDLVVGRAPNARVGQAAQGALGRVAQRFDLVAIRKVVADQDAVRRKLRENPDDAVTLSAMGDILMQQGKRDEAITYYKRAMRADPNYGDAFYKAGLIYDDTHKFQKAVDAYQRALALIHDETEQQKIRERLLVVSGNFLLNHKEFGKAEEKFRQALEILQAKGALVPKEAGAVLWGLAVSNSQQGSLEEAAKWYEQLVALIPAHMGARLNLAFVYEQLEEEEKASAQYNAVRLMENAPPGLKKRAEDRLDYIRRQTNGFSYAVGYSLGFDDNLNSARTNKFFEYRSDLYASAIYKYKLKKGMKFSLNVSPTYTIYHRSEFDFLNLAFNPSLLFDKWGYNWNVGMSRNTQSSVLRPESSSTTTDTFVMDAGWSSEDKVNYRMSLNYRGFGSSQNPFFDANTFNVGFSSNFSATDSAFVSYGYTLTVNNNKNPLGNDYAYIGHGFNGRIDKRLDERLVGYVSGHVSLNLYQHPDSSTGFRDYRRTLNFGFGGGVNYRFGSWASFFAGYNYMTQYSNLPVGLIFSELQSVEGRQSSSLGSFVRNSISVGVRMNF